MVDRRVLLSGAAAMGIAGLVGCGKDSKATPTPSTSASPSATAPSTTPSTQAPVSPRVASEIATGLDVPWGMLFLASGEALVSERNTARVLRITPEGDVTRVGKVAGVVPPGSGGEGGLLGIAFPPGDETTLFAYITTASDNRVVKMSFDGTSLGRSRAVVTGIPTSIHHHGGRLLFADDGNLFISTGDAERPNLAQDKGSLAGKILRVDQRGDAAQGNPFGNRTWSYGHRNVEGLAFDADGRLWATEFGNKAADELNLIRAGKNYGWPRVEGRSDSYTNPKATWRTSDCSPAGLAITKSTAFLGALQGRCLFGVPLEGTDAGTPEAYFADDYGRIRSVTVAPDGALWVTTSNTDGRTSPSPGDDRILRVTV
ncbi:PQQ-dependent sugar dehydrogenase [soil metagenome]